jgi:hypothetical protein
MSAMTMTRTRALLANLLCLGLILAGGLGLTGCGGGDDVDTSGLYKQENTPDNLKGLLEAIVKAQESADLKTAAALAKGLIVDADSLKKFFKDDAPEAFLKQQAERLKQYPATEAELANMILRKSPARTKLTIHAATTEEIAAEATPAAKEFRGPTGVPSDFVVQLRPGTTFYAAEFVEPDKEAGRKFHMFLWVGSRWRMLGPLWAIGTRDRGLAQ